MLHEINKDKAQKRLVSKVLLDGLYVSPPQARQELNPSQVSAYLRIKREPREVDDTCISGDSLKGSAEQIQQ